MEKPAPSCFVVFGVVFAVLFFSNNGAFADKVILENGDTLTGTVEKVLEGKLSLKTDYSAPIEIQVKKIKQLFTDKPVEVHLTGGEILSGQVKTVEDGKLAVEKSPEREGTVVDLDKVASINPPPVVPPKWTGNITAGATSQSGNVRRDSVALSAEAKRRTESDRFSARYLFNYGRDDGTMTTRNHYGSIEYDYFFTKKFFGLGSVELLNDKFQDLTLRTTVGPGVGYQIWEDSIKALALSAGLVYVNENHYEASDRSWIAARLGADFRYKFFDFLVFTDQVLLYPPLESGNGFLLRNDAALTTPLGKRWALKLENIILHNSKPAPTFKETDITTILGLQYSF